MNVILHDARDARGAVDVARGERRLGQRRLPAPAPAQVEPVPVGLEVRQLRRARGAQPARGRGGKGGKGR